MKFTKKVLSNGLVILHEYRDVPVTSVAIASKLGAAYEDSSEKGVSHFLEHMCFKGTSTRSAKELSATLENSGGLLNAFTDECVTSYYATIPSRRASVALDVLTDLYFNPLLDAAEVKKEANVISEEIKMVKDDPEEYVDVKLKQNLYAGSLGLDIAGDVKNVLAVTRDVLVKKHSAFYQPANSILCVVGNTPLEEVAGFFDNFKFPNNSPSVLPPIIVNKTTLKCVESREGIEQANLAIGFHFPSKSSSQRYTASLFNTILGGGMSSRLFLNIREKLGLVYSVQSQYSAEKDFGLLGIFAGAKKKNVRKVMDLALKEFQGMVSISKEDLQNAKERVLGIWEIGQECSMDSAERLIRAELNLGVEQHYLFQDNINAVSLDEVRALAKIDDFASFTLIPKK